MRIHKPLLSMAVCAAFAASLPCVLSAAPITYQVTIDTSSINGTPGYIDLQFNPSIPASDSQPAYVDILNFSTDGTLTPNPSDPNQAPIGEASGSLPLLVTIDNSETTNIYTDGITFGNTITFTLLFDGPAVETPDPGTYPGGSLFTVDVADSNYNYLLETDPAGTNAAQVALNPDGTTTPNPYYTNPYVTFGSTPEPSTITLLSAGIVGLGALALRRRKRNVQ